MLFELFVEIRRAHTHRCCYICKRNFFVQIFRYICLVDMLDGSIYDCEDRYEVKDGKYIFTKMPLTDSPLLITIGEFIK